MKRLIILISILAIQNSIQAQDEFDALRYGYGIYNGTARSNAIGNAMGSLGGDFSSLSINPAGLGVYRRGELVLTPSFNVSKNESKYLGEITTNNASKLNFSNFGLVLTNAKKGNAYKRSGWKAVSFAFGMNRSGNFKNEYSYTGKNYSSSIIERYAEEYNAQGGIATSATLSYPAIAAYQTWLIDKGYGADSTQAVSYVPYMDGIRQTKRVSETGGTQNYEISVGGNYQEKLMLGASLGIPYIQYNRTLQFDEQDISGNNNNDFKYMYFTENLKTTGTGVNLKLGAIFKPTNNFRVGLALHTPTLIQFNDISSISMESHTDSLLLHNNPTASPISFYSQDTALAFNYTQTTPYKAIASATVLFQQYGFLTADFEFVDYSSMKYNFGQGYENESNDINTVLKNTYKSTVNFRVGAEAKLQDFALRAGVSYYGSPYKNQTVDASTLRISGGIGYRTKNWFLDASYIYGTQTYQQMPYVLDRANANVKAADIKNTTGNVAISVGFKF